MYCEICQAFSAMYCTCNTDHQDDGKPITGGRRTDEYKIRMDKLSEFVEALTEKYPKEKSIREVKEYFKMS